jgi:hypothetical protein
VKLKKFDFVIDTEYSGPDLGLATGDPGIGIFHTISLAGLNHIND